MAKEIEKLAEAFMLKDQVESFLSKLEELKTGGSIANEQYTKARQEYYVRLREATSEIARIKNQFKKQLQANQRDIENYRAELGNLEVKYKVGELSPDRYRSSARKLRGEITRLEGVSQEFKRLVEASSYADIIGVPTTEPEITSPEPSPPVAAASRAKKPRTAAQVSAGVGKRGVKKSRATAPGKGTRVLVRRLLAVISVAAVLITSVVFIIRMVVSEPELLPEPETIPEVVLMPDAEDIFSLTSEQREIVELFGWPHSFSILAIEDARGQLHRSETWTYYDGQTTYIFIDGVFQGWEPVEPLTEGSIATPYQPNKFAMGTSPEEVQDLTATGDDWLLMPGINLLFEGIGDDVEMYVAPQLVAGFSGGQLVFVESLALVPEDGE